MRLPIDRIGDPAPGKPTVVILHGLLGSRRDWLPIARRLSHAAAFILPDLPNHGDAPLLDPFAMTAACQAIRQTLRDHAIDRPILLGHSLGGKIAMTLARDTPQAFARLIMADISPRAIPPLHLFILRALLALDLARCATRPQLDAALAQTLPDPALRAYLLRNITRRGRHFAWVSPLRILERDFAIVSDPVDFQTPCPIPAHLIAGGRSPFITPADHTALRAAFPNLTAHTLPHAGHMLHADAPGPLADLLAHVIGNKEPAVQPNPDQKL